MATQKSRGTCLLEVGGDTEGLHTQPQVRCDSDTIFAHHSYNGATVILHDRLDAKGFGKKSNKVNVHLP